MAWIKSMLKLESALRAPIRLSPNFEVRSSPGKGLGVFATKNIPRDAVIMRDPLVFRYEEDENLVERYRRFTMLPNTMQQDILKLAVQKDIKQCVAVILAVKCSMGGKGVDGIVTNIKRIREQREYEDLPIPRIMHLEDVIATNAMSLYADTTSPGGLFLNASRINHSCLPNADQAIDDDAGYYKVMRANRDIGSGEEITTSYIAHFLPREKRQLYLEGWSFTCECPACDPDHPFSHAYEGYLRAISQACEDFCLDEAGRLKTSGTSSYTMLEKAADRANKRIELFAKHHALRKFALQAHLGAFDIALAKYKLRRIRSDLDDALKFLKSIIKADKIYYGKTGAITRAHEELYDRLQKGDI